MNDTKEYTCLNCTSKSGEYVPASPGKPASQNWYHANEPYMAGPFCKRACANAWMSKDEYQRLFVIFKDNTIVESLLKLRIDVAAKGGIAEDRIGVFAWRWLRMPVFQFSEKIDDDKDFGQVKGIARDNRASWQLVLTPCYGAEGEMG